MQSFAVAITGFLDAYGLAAIVAIILVKEIGVPVPIPGDLILIAAAGQAAAGRVSLWQAFAALLGALVLGACVQFVLIRSVGKPVLERLGRFIGLTPARLDAASARLGRGGATAVALGITTPGLRTVTVPACGLARMPLRVFLPGLVAGCAVFLALHFAIGYIGLPVVTAALDKFSVPTLALFVALAAVGFGGWLLIRRSRRRGDGANLIVASAADWADACCPVCVVLGAAEHVRLAVSDGT